MSQDDDFQVEAILDEGVDPSGEKRYFIKHVAQSPRARADKGANFAPCAGG